MWDGKVVEFLKWLGKVSILFYLLHWCFSDPSSVNEKKRRDREERQNIVLWRQPLITLQYFSLEILVILKEWTSK